jgi:hypothetical protein
MTPMNLEGVQSLVSAFVRMVGGAHWSREGED